MRQHLERGIGFEIGAPVEHDGVGLGVLDRDAEPGGEAAAVGALHGTEAKPL